MAVHSDQKKFSCRLFQYATPQKSNLKRNLKTHELKGESTSLSVQNYNNSFPVSIQVKFLSHNLKHDVFDIDNSSTSNLAFDLLKDYRQFNRCSLCRI